MLVIHDSMFTTWLGEKDRPQYQEDVKFLCKLANGKYKAGPVETFRWQPHVGGPVGDDVIGYIVIANE